MGTHAEVLSALAVLARELGVSSLPSMEALRDALHGPCSHCGALCSQAEAGTKQQREEAPISSIDGRHNGRAESATTESGEQNEQSAPITGIWNKFLNVSTSNIIFQGEEVAASPFCPAVLWEHPKALLSSLRRKALVAAAHREIWLPGSLVSAKEVATALSHELDFALIPLFT
ncbi:hypothetical protein T484DRAFT_1753657 [Baffinella frigidus]|nr:hypothetical protein T484DRAFT_1753657 [Cryptophyta sp. CCMP2293]